MPPLQSLNIPTSGYTPIAQTPTSSFVAGAGAISAVTSAFSAYQAGQMRKIAYEHEAAVAEINAKQIEIEGMFVIADKTTELANILALQSVVAAASGRVSGEGSLQQIQATSEAALAKDVERIKVTGRARQVATLMDSETKRAAGQSAAAQGLLSGVSELTTGLAKAERFIA